MERFYLDDDAVPHENGNVVELSYLDRIADDEKALQAFSNQASLALAALKRRDTLSLKFLYNVAVLQLKPLPDLEYYPARYALNTEMVEPSEDGDMVRYREYESRLKVARVILENAQKLKQELTGQWQEADKSYRIVPKAA